MELFTRLFGDLLALVYHCFDRIVIHGYLNGLSRPEQVVHFFRQVLGLAVVDKEVLSQRTNDYQNWVEAFARNHRIPIQWAEKGDLERDVMGNPWVGAAAPLHVVELALVLEGHLLPGMGQEDRVPVWPATLQ